MLHNMMIFNIVHPSLWHHKPVIGVGKYAHAKKITINGQYYLMSGRHLSWQRPQLLDMESAKGLGVRGLTARDHFGLRLLHGVS